MTTKCCTGVDVEESADADSGENKPSNNTDSINTINARYVLYIEQLMN